MKVAVIIDTWFPSIGGGQINAYEISRRLAQHGVRIDIITRNNGVDHLKLQKNLNVIKIGTRANANDTFSQIIFTLRAFFYIYSRDYDLIHAHAFLPGITAWLIKIFKKKSTVFTVHGTSINTNLNNFVWRFAERLILTKITYDNQITVSRDFLKIPNVNKNINYISNGIDIEKFDKIKTQKFEDPTLIFVGRLHKQKNLLTLLKSITKLIKDLPNIKLIIVGKGTQSQQLSKALRSLNLQKNVRMEGEVTGSNLISLYKSSHLFILPSIYEGQPITLLEAWAAKIPVIVPSSGDCQYLVKNGVNGYLVSNPKSSLEITNIIKHAINYKNLEKLGQAGYNLVKHFPWELSAARTLEIYKNVIKSKN